MTKNGAAHTHSSGPCACKEHPKQGFASEVTAAAKPVNNDDSNHMCLWCYASSPVQHRALLKDKWLLIKHILFPSSLPLSSLSLLSGFLCSPAALPPTWGGQVARQWGGGIGRLHAEIDYPSNLRTASVSPGRKLRRESPPPHPLCTNSHPSSVSVPPLSLFLHPLHPSVPVLPEALRDDTKSQLQTGPLARSACLVRHMSRKMGLPWTLPWTRRKNMTRGGVQRGRGLRGRLSWAIEQRRKRQSGLDSKS